MPWLGVATWVDLLARDHFLNSSQICSSVEKVEGTTYRSSSHSSSHLDSTEARLYFLLNKERNREDESIQRWEREKTVMKYSPDCYFFPTWAIWLCWNHFPLHHILTVFWRSLKIFRKEVDSACFPVRRLVRRVSRFPVRLHRQETTAV